MGRFSVEFTLANSEDVVLTRRGLLPADQVRKITIEGLVDTGATRLVIPANVAEQLGVREVGEVQVCYADRRRETRQLVYDVLVELL